MTASAPSFARIGAWTLSLALRQPVSLATVGVTLLLRIGLEVLKPWPMLVLVDCALGGRAMPAFVAAVAELLPGAATRPGLIAWCIGATVMVFLLSWATSLAQGYANITLNQRMTYQLAGDLLSRLQQLSLRFHQRRAIGDTLRRATSDCSSVAAIMRDVLVPVVSSLLTLTVMFVIMWHLSPWLTLLALLVVPSMIWIFRLYAQPMVEKGWQQQEIEGQLYSVVERTFSAVPVMQVFGREEINDRTFRAATAADLTATLAVTGLHLRFRLLMGLATAVGTAGILWIGAGQALTGTASVGVILLFVSYLGSLYAPVEAVMYTSANLQTATGSVLRVWEVLHAEREVVDQPGAIILPRPSGHVRFERVTFGYEPGSPVLRQVNLEVTPGETIALVGATGAGKTTLVSLLPRFFDPDEGRVLIDGHDLRDVQLKSLRHQIALVLQEPFLFPITLAENIAYGRPTATKEEIEAAAQAANAFEFITRLPAGFHTVIGERGATLSGGERQRVSIARALLKDAPLLILDEPTSALDAETEAGMLQALARLTRERTTFIIAHRLSTIRNATRIVVLDQGRIVETGTHDQLLRAGGTYARLHAIQFGHSPAPAPPHT